MDDTMTILLNRRPRQRQRFEKLNLDEIDSIHTESFRALGMQRLANGESLPLARVQTRGAAHYYEASGLNAWMKQNRSRNFQPCHASRSPMSNLPITNIDYYTCNVVARTALYTHSYPHILYTQAAIPQEEQLADDHENMIANQANDPINRDDRTKAAIPKEICNYVLGPLCGCVLILPALCCDTVECLNAEQIECCYNTRISLLLCQSYLDLCGITIGITIKQPPRPMELRLSRSHSDDGSDSDSDDD
jgi:hypothetical protein